MINQNRNNLEEKWKIKHNNYLLKSELTMRISMLIFFVWLTSINIVPESDPLDEVYRKLALSSAIIGIIWVILHNIKMFWALKKHTLLIKNFSDHILYEYINEKGELKTDFLNKEKIISVKWSFFPYAIKDTEIWITEIKNIDNKRWAYLFSLFYILVSFVYLIIYIIINMKIEKYILYRFDNGIIALPYDKELINHKDNIQFEWRSLVNRYILKGGYYAD